MLFQFHRRRLIDFKDAVINLNVSSTYSSFVKSELQNHESGLTSFLLIDCSIFCPNVNVFRFMSVENPLISASPCKLFCSK